MRTRGTCYSSPTASVVNELTVKTARGKKCPLVFMPRLGEGGCGCKGPGGGGQIVDSSHPARLSHSEPRGHLLSTFMPCVL